MFTSTDSGIEHMTEQAYEEWREANDPGELPECPDCGNRHEEGPEGKCSACCETCEGWGHLPERGDDIGGLPCPSCEGSGLKDNTEVIPGNEVR